MRWLVFLICLTASAQELPSPPPVQIGTKLDPFLFLSKDFEGTVTSIGGLTRVELPIDFDAFPEGYVTGAKCVIRYAGTKYHDKNFRNTHNGFEVQLPKGVEVTYRCWGILRKHIPRWINDLWQCPTGLQLQGPDTDIKKVPRCIDPELKKEAQ